MSNSATISLNYVQSNAVTETFSEANPGGTPTFDPQFTNLTLNAGTTPAVSAHSPFTATLSSGSLQVDLYNLPGITQFEIVNMSGLKVQSYAFEVLTNNANSITIKAADSNGYNIFGTGGVHVMQPGEQVQGYTDGAAPTVNSTQRYLNISGTGAQQLLIQLVGG